MGESRGTRNGLDQGGEEGGGERGGGVIISRGSMADITSLKSQEVKAENSVEGARANNICY